MRKLILFIFCFLIHSSLSLALVEVDKVLETLDDLFAIRKLTFLEEEGDMGSYMNFITGPSRTGDIEQTIVKGVHGPKEVSLLLIG